MNDERIAAIEAPRQAARLVGHAEAEAAFLAAWNSGRLAHAWVVGGPPGIGKASFAYLCARHVLSGARLSGATGERLGEGGDPRALRQIEGGFHPGLRVVRRGLTPATPPRLRTEIVVEDIRALAPFFHQTAAGWRVAIIDAADEMNVNAANALLKLLEEPPPRTLLFLVAHAPGRLLPTLRSRCRRLGLRPLSAADTLSVLRQQAPRMPAEEAALLAKLAAGAPGRALALAEAGGGELYRAMLDLLASAPELDVGRLHALAERCGSTSGDGAFRAVEGLLRDWLQGLIRAKAAPSEAAWPDAAAAKLAPARGLADWLGVWEKIGGLFARADSLALDRKQVVLNAFLAVAGA